MGFSPIPFRQCICVPHGAPCSESAMPTPVDFASVRREYDAKPLVEDDAGDDPFTLFRAWMAEAITVGVHEPNAMTLATVDGAGRPSARIVLMKSFDEQGLTFFTSYLGRKAKDLAA